MHSEKICFPSIADNDFLTYIFLHLLFYEYYSKLFLQFIILIKLFFILHILSIDTFSDLFKNQNHYLGKKFYIGLYINYIIITII